MGLLTWIAKRAMRIAELPSCFTPKALHSQAQGRRAAAHPGSAEPAIDKRPCKGRTSLRAQGWASRTSMKDERYRLVARDKPGLLVAMMKALASGAYISFEGDLSQCRLAEISGASLNERESLKRNTLFPRQEFVVLPLEHDTIGPICEEVLPEGRIAHNICHVQIEKNGSLAFGAYDNFHPECIGVSGLVPRGLLEQLQSNGVLRSFRRCREASPMHVHDAIREAESLLPGEPAEDSPDPRWQAIIRLGEYIESDPEAVWEFIRQWGGHPQKDLRDAIATCLLEHLLEHHFATYFPRVEELALADPRFADTFQRCWRFGQADERGNAERFKRLKQRLRQQSGNGESVEHP